MSDFTVIQAASRTLQELLRASITLSTDPQLNGVPIDLRSPKEMREEDDNGISLWLYRVMRNTDVYNQPPVRLGPAITQRRRLPLDLYYLITPLAENPADEQVLLGRVLQVFHDHPIVRGSFLQDALEGSPEELRLVWEPLTLEELTRVWDALKESYQLSVSYMVQVVLIDSAEDVIKGSPVFEANTAYTQILSSE